MTNEQLCWAISVASTVLAVVAIWLSIHFFVKGKDSEKAVEKALEGIKAQTDTLQKVASRQLDRLTRYATEPRPADFLDTVVTDTFRVVLSQFQASSQASASGDLRSELVATWAVYLLCDS